MYAYMYMYRFGGGTSAHTRGYAVCRNNRGCGFYWLVTKGKGGAPKTPPLKGG